MALVYRTNCNLGAEAQELFQGLPGYPEYCEKMQVMTEDQAEAWIGMKGLAAAEAKVATEQRADAQTHADEKENGGERPWGGVQCQSPLHEGQARGIYI